MGLIPIRADLGTKGRWRRLNGSDAWLKMPKFVVTGGNDEFFLPADDHLWWEALPGDKRLLHIPNSDHGFNLPTRSGETVYEAALRAFYHAIVRGSRRESFTWRLVEIDHSAT